MAVRDPIPNYSTTKRIVLLIDLNPLLYLQDPAPYLTSLLSSTKTLLSFPPLSSSLFSFKPFFSSLSPLLSSSKLPVSSLSLSFDLPDFTLLSLTSLLSSLTEKFAPSSASSLPPPRASNVATSMRQLLHDYAWDPMIRDDLDTGTLSDSDSDFAVVRSNLVVLFSPVCKDRKWVCEFLELDDAEEYVDSGNTFNKRFCGFFECVNDAFVSRDIHVSWVDVKCELDCSEEECQTGIFQSGIRDLGWGFCSSTLFVLGSALVPFGLIYPLLGVSSCFSGFNECNKRIQGQLSLEILDVNGKPLKCKCCDIELFDLKALSRNSSPDPSHVLEFVSSQTGNDKQKKTFWEVFDGGIAKLHVKAVKRYAEPVKFEGHFLDPILVREFSGESVKNQGDSSVESLGDRVLQLLAAHMGDHKQRKSIPFWHILLSFLYREGYWAVVCISNGDEESHMGVLKPFTISSGFLLIIGDGLNCHDLFNGSSGTNFAQLATKTDGTICKPKVDFFYSHGINESMSMPSPSKKGATVGGGQGRKNKKDLHLLQDLSWNAFCKAAYQQFQVDLEDVYFSQGYKSSKKLKFLKCWIKQVRKSSHYDLTMPDRFKPNEDIPKAVNDRLTELPEESEQPFPSSASVGEDASAGASRIQDEVALDFRSDTAESFFSNLHNKIEQGLESGWVDLRSMAKRLVNSSIYWLYQKREVKTSLESPAQKSDAVCDNVVSVELAKVLLRDPKDLIAKHKNDDASHQASEARASGFSKEYIIREYESQILFRMEILQSEIGATIMESTKQKFVKQICMFLETIQCHMEGGFFGEWSLDNYVGTIIKSRVSDQCLKFQVL
ncbi:uncharacterized protein LOC119985207 isoform X2 [Tripterygium wilfordii]|uniref:uncharacterized protein LOC119985207 isoform X2 n=1 Tax=Tripterygium wilfordii TaxID=458696 RepID=UPI0018F80D04|nr:uncharacterized protein LOC119985207 isoform X2 [Tripterygium wilfordii]